MPIQEVFLDFNEEDEAVISVKGVAGKSCKDITRELENALGAVKDEKLTEDYHKTSAKQGKQVFQK